MFIDDRLLVQNPTMHNQWNETKKQTIDDIYHEHDTSKNVFGNEEENNG